MIRPNEDMPIRDLWMNMFKLSFLKKANNVYLKKQHVFKLCLHRQHVDVQYPYELHLARAKFRYSMIWVSLHMSDI